jgi:hypothetical protein
MRAHLPGICIVAMHDNDAAGLPVHVLQLGLLLAHVLDGTVGVLANERPQQLLAKVDVRVAGSQANDVGAAALRRILLLVQALFRNAIGAVDRGVCREACQGTAQHSECRSAHR